MDEFDIYLESTGSMDTYHTNTMACFRNVLAEPLYLEGDWRVAIAEIIYPSSIKNVTTIEKNFQFIIEKFSKLKLCRVTFRRVFKHLRWRVTVTVPRFQCCKHRFILQAQLMGASEGTLTCHLHATQGLIVTPWAPKTNKSKKRFF